MGEGCCSGSGCGCSAPRNFPTKEEKLEMLKEYKMQLEKELKGVQEKMDQMKN